jgi:hypothetical protein
MSWEKEEVARVLASKPGTWYQEASDSDKKLFQQWLKDHLRRFPTTVQFTKADGTKRAMKCTLDFSNIIPSPLVASVTESTKVKKPNENVLVVWDIDQAAWRSFRFDRITSVIFDLA